MGHNNLATLGLEDILADPARFGMPSFDEFAKNPDKFRKRADELFETIDNGSRTIRQHVRKHLYEFEGHRVDTIEQLDRIMKDEGLTDETVTWKPDVVPLQDGSGKCDIVHRIKRKSRLILL